MSAEIVELVTRRWAEYGIATDPDARTAPSARVDALRRPVTSLTTHESRPD